jgi:hypothetical protein
MDDDDGCDDRAGVGDYRSSSMTTEGKSSPAWTCRTCTFVHAGPKAELTTCTICGSNAASAVAAPVFDLTSEDTVTADGSSSSSSAAPHKKARTSYDGAAAPIIYVSLLDSDDDDDDDGLGDTLDAGGGGGGSGGGAAAGLQRRDDGFVDLTQDSDEQIARRLQQSFDAELGTLPGHGGRIDFAALNAARQQRMASRRGGTAEQQRREQDGGGRGAEEDDLLYEQRRGLMGACQRSAQKLGLQVARLEPNRFSQPGCPLYTRFVAAWRRVPDKSLKIVYHGTPEANIGAICRTGLDPKRRSGQALGKGEYFGGEVSVSAAYSRGGRKMIMFAVLLDRAGLTHDDAHVTVPPP